MLHETISLHDNFPEANLISYVIDNSQELQAPPRRAILILPGGGYGFLSDREGEPMARLFMAAGMNAFVLKYGVKGNSLFPRPLIQASLAMKHIRDNAQKYNIDPDHVYVIGFSAGGHLAASLGTLWHRSDLLAGYDIPYGINKPTGMILSYPVISSGQYAHKGSFYNILGTNTPTEEQLKLYSIELVADEKAAPAFIWHTYSDKTVPVENALLMASALREHKVPFELHIFPEGPHGIALSTDETSKGKIEWANPHVANWTKLVTEWIFTL